MQNTSTSRSTDFRRQKTITSKTPLTLYGRGFCASDRTPTTTGSPAGPQSNQNVWVLPPISCNASRKAFPHQMTPQSREKKLRKRPFFDTADRHEKLYARSRLYASAQGRHETGGVLSLFSSLSFFDISIQNSVQR